MNKSPEKLNESLGKIKFLINYDSSKTRIENSESVISEQVGVTAAPFISGSIAAKQAAKTPKGTSQENMGSRGEATRTDIQSTVRAVKREIRGDIINDSVNIRNIYTILRNRVSGKTYKGQRAIDVVASDYQRRFGSNLADDIENKITRLNFKGNETKQLVLDLIQPKQPEQPDIHTKISDLPKPKINVGSAGGNKQGYRYTNGTSDDPFKYGTWGSGIGTIQQAMGLVADGKWGPKTQAKMKELVPEYINGFTMDDVLKVTQAIRAKTQPEAQPIARSTEPTVNPSVAPRLSAANLAQTTLAEEKKKLSEQTKTGEMLGKTAAVAGGALSAGALAGAAIGRAGRATKTSMGALAIGSLLLGPGKAALLPATAITSVGGAAIAGAAALALVPLVLWLIDKDKARPKVEKLFKYVEDNKSKIDQVPRGLSDEQIWDAADQLFVAMKRLGTRERAVYRVFESLKTVSDLSALITFYDQDNKISLMKQLDRDFNMTRQWMKIYRPIRNLVLRFAKEMSQNAPEESPDTNVGGAGGGAYKFVDGTTTPYVLGTKGHGIVKVQECLGLKTDGMFGPITQSRLAQIDGSYSQSFTNNDIAEICRAGRVKRETPISVKGAVGKTAGPIAKSPRIGTNLSLSKLAPMNTSSNERMKEIISNVRRNKKYVGPPLSPDEQSFVNTYIGKMR